MKNLLFFICGVGFIFSCEKNKVVSSISNCEPNHIYFNNDVLPLISSNCASSGCHDSKTKKEGYDLSNYNGIMKLVNTKDPSESELLKVLTGSDIMPPAPRSPLSSLQSELLLKWITQGAQYDSCDLGCNSDSVSFANDITPLISANCLSCHSGTSIYGGVDLSSYNGVKASVTNGKLAPSINRTGSFPMPPSLPLSSCQQNKIITWINAGALNN